MAKRVYETLSGFDNSVVVSHPGKQHSFHTATALKKAGLLKKYITTVYYKPERWIYKLLERVLGESSESARMHTRRCAALEDKDVKQFYEFAGLFLLLLLRLDKSGSFASQFMYSMQDWFSVRAAQYAVQEKVKCVVMYDTSALYGFRKLEAHPQIIKVLDVSSAALNYTCEMLREEREQAGDLYPAFKKYDYLDNSAMLERICEEIRIADYFLVASDFAKKSLIYNGVKENQIYIVPYGVDISQFQYHKHSVPINRPIRFLYVGSIEPRKGSIHMFEAFRRMNNSEVRLSIAGSFIGERSLYKQFEPWFDYLGHLPISQIHEVYKKHDVFIQPSLHEGFGLVILEAMSSGLPVICSDHTVGPDIIENGLDGFVFPAGDTNALIEKIRWFVEHRERIVDMGYNARCKSQQFTWDTYNKNCEAAIRDILKRGSRKSHEI